MSLKPIVVHRDQLEPIHWIGEHGRWILTSAETGGLFTFMEINTQPGAGPPLHIHEEVDEAFFVVDGHYRFRVGDDVIDAPAGTMVYGPRGIAHQFENISSEQSRMHIVSTPGGVEKFFEDLSKITGGGAHRPDWDRMVEVAARHRVRHVGPPPGAPAKGSGFGGVQH